MNLQLKSRRSSPLRPTLAAAVFVVGICPLAWAWSPGTASPSAVQGFVVDASIRTDVLSFYNTIYPASEGYAQNMAWTGNVTSGSPGTTSAAFKDDVRRRINFYRALVGLPADIVFNATKSSKCQEAALMMSANDQLSHYPPASWTFYTANGAEAAGNSNLGLGSYGAGVVDGYITDSGSNNNPVGHRRWLLYSLANEMGTGDIPQTETKRSANAIWVVGNFKASGPKGFVTWPNKGYTPQDLVPARWSISYPGAGFGSATVAMTQGGVAVPVSVVSRSDTGIGDNTLVWEPTGLQVSGLQDVPYNVTVSSISGTGVPSSYSYTVTAFNPDVLGQSVTISGSSTPAVSGQDYTFNATSQADQYQLRVSTGSTAGWTEGAESLATITDLTAPDYPLAQSTVKRSGTQAFHLTIPSFAAGDQGFEVARDIVPTASSQLLFYDLFRFVTTASRLSAELSEDNGSTWTEIWARNGNGSTSSSGWDAAFNARSVSLAAYAAKPVRVRFIFRANNSAFTGTSTDVGIFLDDISVSNATELVNTTTTALAGSATSFTLNASTAGSPLMAGTSYYLRIRPNVGTRWFGDGALKTVTATGTPEIAVEQAAGTNLTDGSASIDCGSVNLGSASGALTFTVKNVGTADLTGLLVSKTGTNPGDFSLGSLGATTLAAGASTTFTVTFTPGAAGARAATLRIASNDADENPFDIDLTGDGTVPPQQVADAIEQPGIVITAGGAAAWFAQTETTHDGIDAARSGAISHGQASWMQTTLTGPGTLTYWWKVSSQPNHDFLEFLLDDSVQGEGISGSVEWQKETYSIAAGEHTVTWRYQKDDSGNTGMDAGWLDEVNFVPTVPSALTTWLLANGLPADTDLLDDPNGDGVNLLLAYALNLDPKLDLSGSMPRPVFAANQMSLAFYAGNSDVSYSVESSTDLQTWSIAGVTISAPDANNIRTATMEMNGPRRYMRLVIVH
jgi:hypothetical protein